MGACREVESIAMDITDTDLAFLPAAELARRIRVGEVTSFDVTERFLTRINRYDSKLHAYIAVYEDEARMAAEAADLAIKAGQAVGPFHGVPVALKDIIEIEGRIGPRSQGRARSRRHHQ